MQTFIQYLKEDKDQLNPYHKILTHHGFRHEATAKHPIGVGFRHTYMHPEGDTIKADHIGKERMWSHEGFGSDKAGHTIKGLDTHLSNVAKKRTMKESGPEFSKGDGPIPDHTKQPFHSTLMKHGFEHKSSKEGGYKGSEWHDYEHPTKGHMSATIFPKGHDMGETHWRHSHPNPENRQKSSSAGKTPKSLDDYLNHPDGKSAKIRGVHHMGY